jgi:hypothetical protein
MRAIAFPLAFVGPEQGRERGRTVSVVSMEYEKREEKKKTHETHTPRANLPVHEEVLLARIRHPPPHPIPP